MSVFSGSSFKRALRSSGLDCRPDVLTAPSRLSRTTNNEHCSNTGTHTPPVGLTSQIAIARTEQISLVNTRDARSHRDGTGEVVAVIGATATTSPSGVPGDCSQLSSPPALARQRQFSPSCDQTSRSFPPAPPARVRTRAGGVRANDRTHRDRSGRVLRGLGWLVRSGDRAQAGACTPGRSTASRCLAGMRSAELA